MTHYVRFRGVCSSWRRFTAAPNHMESRFRPKNWVLMMAGEAKIAAADEEQCYLNIRTCTSLRINILDLLTNHTILSTVDGLLVLMHNETTNVCLLNPITRSFTHDLPPLSTVLTMIPAGGQVDVEHLHRVLVSVQFASSTVVLNFRDFPLVVYAKAGDRRWSRTRERVELSSTESFLDQLYGVSRKGEVFKFEPPPETRAPAKLVHVVSVLEGECYLYHVLVESGGKLLVVSMSIAVGNHPNNGAYLFADVREVDVQNRRLLPMMNLGRNALFLCCNKSLSLSCSIFPSLKDNFMCFIQSTQLPVHLFYAVRYYGAVTNRFPMYHVHHECVHRPFPIADQIIFYCRGFQTPLQLPG